MKSMQVPWLAAAVTLLGWTFTAAADDLRPGRYEGLMLAIDRQGRVTGYFREDQGQGVVKSCQFFLSGRKRGVRADVLTWSTIALPGRLAMTVDGLLLKLPKGREHAGCGLVLPPQIDTGLTLDKIFDAGWQQLRRVAVERARLHPRPDADPGRAFVVRGDVVGVLERQGDWLRVEHQSDSRSTRGWIRSIHTAALQPRDRCQPACNQRRIDRPCRRG